MPINLAAMLPSFIIGGITGFLVVFLVLNKFPMKFRLKIGGGAFLSALGVALLYVIFQNIVFSFITVVIWAFYWLFVIADYGVKAIPDLKSSAEPLEMIEENAGNLAGLMLALIAFILGAVSAFFNNATDRFTLVGFAVPPLIAAISMAICMYFATKYFMIKEGSMKKYYLKKSLIWWDIGQTIFISTAISMAIFVALMIDKIIV